ncbi:hypothetical protein M9Y10_037151 [Tritrichomonas musculus]|uniref:Uncharacterized protein n=1 Tax=Tritrichomonas musculus TaxID=1915356 RepID=A0ABR2GT26_9EUKA
MIETDTNEPPPTNDNDINNSNQPNIPTNNTNNVNDSNINPPNETSNIDNNDIQQSNAIYNTSNDIQPTEAEENKGDETDNNLGNEDTKEPTIINDSKGNSENNDTKYPPNSTLINEKENIIANISNNSEGKSNNEEENVLNNSNNNLKGNPSNQESEFLNESGDQIDLSNKNDNNKDEENDTDWFLPRPPSNRFSFTYSPRRRFDSYSNEDQFGLQIKPLNVSGNKEKAEPQKEENKNYNTNKSKSARRQKYPPPIEETKRSRSLRINRKDNFEETPMTRINNVSDDDYSFEQRKTRTAPIRDYSYLLEPASNVSAKDKYIDEARLALGGIYMKYNTGTTGLQGTGVARMLPNDLTCTMRVKRPSVKRVRPPFKYRKRNDFFKKANNV